MDICEPTTITELLVRSALDSSSALYFLDDNGDVTSSLTYGELIETARLVAKALLSFGLATGGKDIVVTNFNDQRTHILMFWACTFGRSIMFSRICLVADYLYFSSCSGHSYLSNTSFPSGRNPSIFASPASSRALPQAYLCF